MGHMSSSRQSAIMRVRKIIMKCVPIIYRILQNRQLTLERAQCHFTHILKLVTLPNRAKKT